MTATPLLSTGVLLVRLRQIERARDQLNLEHARLTTALEQRGVQRPRLRRPEPVHGTDSGYHAHRRTWHTPACEPCLRAHAASNAAREPGEVPWDEVRARLTERGVATGVVRRWARRQGLEVPPSGKTPSRLILAWLEAHPADDPAAAAA